MEIDRPGPGEELNRGPETTPRPAATVSVLRGGAEALEASRQGELLLVFPTIKHLEQLSSFASTDQLLEHARRREIRPVEPRVLVSGETARVVLPGEPGYADEP